MGPRDDFVDQYIEERAQREPEFPELVEAALERRKLLRELAAAREDAGISQTVIAARMGTSQSAVARIEAGGADVRLSTVGRYAAAVGKRISWAIDSRSGSATARKPARREQNRPVTRNRIGAPGRSRTSTHGLGNRRSVR